MLTIAFAGSVSESQFARVQQALLPFWMRWYVVVPLCLLCFIQFGAGWAAVSAEPSKAIPDVVWAVAVLAGCWVIVRLGRRRAWREHVRIHQAVSGELSASGLEWKTSITSTSLPWSKILGFQISRDLALLYYAPRCAFYFPRSFMATENEWLSFQQLARTHSKPI